MEREAARRAEEERRWKEKQEKAAREAVCLRAREAVCLRAREAVCLRCRGGWGGLGCGRRICDQVFPGLHQGWSAALVTG